MNARDQPDANGHELHFCSDCFGKPIGAIVELVAGRTAAWNARYSYGLNAGTLQAKAR